MEYKSLFIVGRQPAIGRAELESVLGAAHITPAGEHAVLSDIGPEGVPFARFGGSIRLARVITELNTTQWPGIARYLAGYVKREAAALPEGKIKLGLSCFGLPVTAKYLMHAGLELKKACKAAGHSARVVPVSEGTALSSAQVLHNQLTGELGLELLIVRDGDHTWLARTTAVQDITAYARRDQGRPKRDARVGMLPPKLAQIILNLAAADAEPQPGTTLLDPFCGTGVVLQEAALMGFGLYGSDLEPRMVDYTARNLEWLSSQINSADLSLKLEVGDATDHQWEPAPQIIACETYLGRPLTSWPDHVTLHDIIGTCNVIIEKFLTNIAGQIPPGTRLCLAAPAWNDPNGRTHHLPLLDRLSDLGYNRVSFEHAAASELTYSRPDQIVARELLVITRK